MITVSRATGSYLDCFSPHHLFDWILKTMPIEQRPGDAELDELSATLNEGLKTCRSVIENYRAMLDVKESLPANDADPTWTGKSSPHADAE